MTGSDLNYPEAGSPTTAMTDSPCHSEVESPTKEPAQMTESLHHPEAESTRKHMSESS